MQMDVDRYATIWVTWRLHGAYTARLFEVIVKKIKFAAGMGVRRKWSSATGSGERPAGLAGRGYPARSWRLREGRRTCACDVFDKSPFWLFGRLCMVRQAACPSGLIDQAGLHRGYMASRKQKAQS